MDNGLFPQIKKGIEDFMAEEEGNISRSKVAMIGSIMVVLAVMLADSEIFAAHRSHSSHSSHSSHRSGSSGYHSSHVSHVSHKSHVSGSHSSHSSSSHSSSSGSTTSTFKLPAMKTPHATPDMH